MSMHIAIRNTLFLALFVLVGFTAQAQKEEQLQPNYKGCQVFVPNAFTPNGDNLNDHFEVKYNPDCQVLEYGLRVFDRWGRLVFETTSAAKDHAWDGSSQGKKLNAGVYMWRLSMKMVNTNDDGKPIQVNKQGSLVLIR